MWLVTGSNGYIGRKLVYEWSERFKDSNLVGIDLRNDGNWPKNYIHVEGSICDLELLNNIISRNKFEGVIHLAALKNAMSEDLENYWRINVAASQELAFIAARNKVEKFIFASSAAVYDDSENNTCQKSVENQILKPKSIYGLTKYLSEQYLEAISNNTELNTIIMRFFNVYGVYDDMFNINMNDSIMFKIARAIIDNESFFLRGNNFSTKDGSACRDYIHVQDIVESILALTQIQLPSESRSIVLNIGSGKATSNIEIIRKFEKIAQRNLNLIYANRSKNEIAYSEAEIEKLSNLIGWFPEEINDESLKDIYSKVSFNKF